MSFRPIVVMLALVLGAVSSARAQENDGIAPLLARIEQASKSGDTTAFLALLTTSANRERATDFCGSEPLETRFDAAFIRLNPADFDSAIAASQLQAKVAEPREFRRADEVFRDDSAKSFQIDLADLSRESWSLLPGTGDFLAEIHTR